MNAKDSTMTSQDFVDHENGLSRVGRFTAATLEFATLAANGILKAGEAGVKQIFGTRKNSKRTENVSKVIKKVFVETLNEEGVPEPLARSDAGTVSGLDRVAELEKMIEIEKRINLQKMADLEKMIEIEKRNNAEKICELEKLINLEKRTDLEQRTDLQAEGRAGAGQALLEALGPGRGGCRSLFLVFFEEIQHGGILLPELSSRESGHTGALLILPV